MGINRQHKPISQRKMGAVLPILSTTKAFLVVKRAFHDDKRAGLPRE